MPDPVVQNPAQNVDHEAAVVQSIIDKHVSARLAYTSAVLGKLYENASVSADFVALALGDLRLERRYAKPALKRIYEIEADQVEFVMDLIDSIDRCEAAKTLRILLEGTAEEYSPVLISELSRLGSEYRRWRDLLLAKSALSKIDLCKLEPSKVDKVLDSLGAPVIPHLAREGNDLRYGEFTIYVRFLEIVISLRRVVPETTCIYERLGADIERLYQAAGPLAVQLYLSPYRDLLSSNNRLSLRLAVISDSDEDQSPGVKLEGFSGCVGVSPSVHFSEFTLLERYNLLEGNREKVEQVLTWKVVSDVLLLVKETKNAAGAIDQIYDFLKRAEEAGIAPRRFFDEFKGAKPQELFYLILSCAELKGAADFETLFSLKKFGVPVAQITTLFESGIDRELVPGMRLREALISLMTKPAARNGLLYVLHKEIDFLVADEFESDRQLILDALRESADAKRVFTVFRQCLLAGNQDKARVILHLGAAGSSNSALSMELSRLERLSPEACKKLAESSDSKNVRSFVQIARSRSVPNTERRNTTPRPDRLTVVSELVAAGKLPIKPSVFHAVHSSLGPKRAVRLLTLATSQDPALVAFCEAVTEFGANLLFHKILDDNLLFREYRQLLVKDDDRKAQLQDTLRVYQGINDIAALENPFAMLSSILLQAKVSGHRTQTKDPANEIDDLLSRVTLKFSRIVLVASADHWFKTDAAEQVKASANGFPIEIKWARHGAPIRGIASDDYVLYLTGGNGHVVRDALSLVTSSAQRTHLPHIGISGLKRVVSKLAQKGQSFAAKP